jgi:hypothetical protein
MWLREAVSGRMYPDWIRTGGLQDGEIPVFFCHGITRSRFERDLQHLKRNGYATVTADEYYECVTRGRGSRERLVMLTFDDGLADLHEVVFPLLKHFDMKAVAYIVPNWVGAEGMVTWAQVERMHKSGVLDVQSHGMTHRAIYVAPYVEDLFPSRLYADCRYLYPLQLAQARIPECYRGMPLYTAQSRLSDHRRFLPSGDVEWFCFDFIQRHGDQSFFSNRTWKSVLLREITRRGLKKCPAGSYESLDEQYAEVASEVTRSKVAIERVLPEKRVLHFAYPWHQGGIQAARALVEAGYQTVAGGLNVDGGAPARSAPLPVARVNLDFLACLPGDGRRRMEHVLVLKMIRRIVQERRLAGRRVDRSIQRGAPLGSDKTS